MATLGNPVTFSAHFGVDPQLLARLGVLDPTLAIDTRLFVDPLLLADSVHRELNTTAKQQYDQHFSNVIRLLSASRQQNDVAWRAARQLLTFHEIPGTCLGYGTNSIRGSAFGKELTERVLIVSKEIVDLGVADPDLFPLLAMFEEKIGPDRISDMTTNTIRAALGAFNARVLAEINLQGEQFNLDGVRGTFAVNPFQEERTPVILVPTDILRDLPIALDWDDVGRAAAENEDLRRRVNQHIGHIWAATTKRSKAELRDQALASAEAFRALLDAAHGVSRRAYDVVADSEGLLRWSRVAADYTQRFPLMIQGPIHDLGDVFNAVRRIVEDFRHMIESRGLNRELYRDNGTPRKEATAQRLFHAMAWSHCRANNLDISPETDVGVGSQILGTPPRLFFSE